MNVIAMRLRPAETRTLAPDLNLARVEVFEDFAAAEPAWRALEAGPLFATPYQRFDFLKLWQRHVGVPAGVTPFIVTGFNAAGAPLFLWPLGRRNVGPARVVEFLGGKHANFNMGLWRSGAAEATGADEIRAVLARIADRADLLHLSSQPLSWGGATNPFALLPYQRSVNFGFSGGLIPDFEALLHARTNASARKKMRKKERALAGYGDVRFARATTPEEARHVLDVFFKQKSQRMRQRGVTDVFSQAGVRRFVEAAAVEGLAAGEPLIELYKLTVDDIVVATLGGIAADGRFCAMFNSIAGGRYAVESPGEQMILNLVRRCCERNFHTFDLGIGAAHYKNLFCGDAEPLFDSFIPLSGKGRALAVAMRGATAAKRMVKQYPPLWSMVQAVRRLRGKLRPMG
jgi:CelD/BcsL family acetyltransferase involved in cellulose biosynthesis